MHPIRFLLHFAAVVSIPASAGGATYYFSTGGNDANPGTESRPKQSLKEVAVLLQPGNTIKLKRGDTWYIGSEQWEVTGKRGTAEKPILVEAYGVGAKPAIAAMFRLQDQWKSAGGNRWVHPAAGITQCFLNGVRLKAVPAAEELKDARECFLAPAEVHIISIVDPNRSALVEVVKAGKPLQLRDCAHLTFRQIEFKGGGGGGVVQLQAPTDHVTLDSCDLRMSNSLALHFTGPEGAVGHSHPVVRNCVFDKVWSRYLNGAFEHGGEGIRTSATIDRALIQGNRVTNFGHTGMKLHFMRNSIVELNEMTAGESNYMRAIALYDPTSSDNIVRRNYFHDMHQPSKCGGVRNKYYSNLFVRHSKGVPKASEKTQGNATGMGGEIFLAQGNYFVNNIVYDTEADAFGVQTQGAKQNFIFNNLFVGSRNGYLLRSYRKVAEPQIVENNCFWNGAPDQEVVYMTNAGYTVRGADEKFDEWARNLQQDPLFVDARRDNFRLQPDSPCVRAGKNIADLMGPGFVDFDGRPWDPKNPSIGAYQFSPAGNSLTAAPRTN